MSRLYFSGVADIKTYDLLLQAGVRRILVDQFDLKNISARRQDTVLDSGAYRAMKARRTLDVPTYAQTIIEADDCQFRHFKIFRCRALRSYHLSKYEDVATKRGPCKETFET